MKADLAQTLAQTLPLDVRAKFHHLRTGAQKHEWVLYVEKPPSATLESHLLVVSLCDNETFVFAMEVLVYSTAHRRVFFVSKADSTGYGRQISLAGIASAFLSFLLTTRSTKGVATELSLFARSQSQYLFLGSADNGVKHVLDDYGLIKWWLKVLDTLASTKAFVTVPGISEHETLRLAPSSKWTCGHPFPNTRLATQVIPHLPDDPKSRYLDDIRAEGREVTVEEFWQTMSFRQECSLGRLTGFFWLQTRSNENATQSEVGVKAEERAFRHCHESLLRGDYSSPSKAKSATADWIKTCALGSQQSWGHEVVGCMQKVDKRKSNETPINIIAPRKKNKTTR